MLLQLMDVLFERRGHIARLEEDGISGCIGVTVSQEFFFSKERDVQHQLLPTILLVLGTAGVRREVGTNNHHNSFSPPRWV